MSAAREEILARIRGALRDVPAGEHRGDVAIPRGYRTASGLTAEQALELFVERISHYEAEVTRAGPDDVAAVVAGYLGRAGARRVALPPALPPGWVPPDVDAVVDDAFQTTAALEGCDAALTGCRLAIAATGTIVLDGGAGQGRRVLSLVVDHHVCVVRAGQVVGSVPEAIRSLDGRRPLTFISGPSATVDIEFVRVGGVHGPRRLDVILVAG